MSSTLDPGSFLSALFLLSEELLDLAFWFTLSSLSDYSSLGLSPCELEEVFFASGLSSYLRLSMSSWGIQKV